MKRVVQRCRVIVDGVGVGRSRGRGDGVRGVVECVQCESSFPSCFITSQLAFKYSLFTSFDPCSQQTASCLVPHSWNQMEKTWVQMSAEDVQEPQLATWFRDVCSTAWVRNQWRLSGENRLRQCCRQLVCCCARCPVDSPATRGTCGGVPSARSQRKGAVSPTSP